MRSSILFRLALLAGAVAASTALHCSGASSSPLTGAFDGGASNGGPDALGGPTADDRPLVPASKVDVLVAVDNSASMGDKAAALASSIGTLLRDVAKVGDVHVGVVTSSLGNFGGDICTASNPATNGHAHLQNVDASGAAVPGVVNGVLAFSGGDVEAFVSGAQSLVRGVGQVGCGFEAQLETMYHFLVQPDPWVDVKVDGAEVADLGTAVDDAVLAQRKAFLRPDSALVVIMLTDEDDSSADPLAVAGQGWAYEARSFPGSKVTRGSAPLGTTAPRGTSTCDTAPTSSDCTSCAFQSFCDPNTPECQKMRADTNCRTSGQPGQSGDGYDGYYAAADDALNVRFYRMKQRFGVDPQYPIARYVDGLTQPGVPNRATEHVSTTDSGHRVVAPYTSTPTCTNPIFAASLPASGAEELCALPRGPRSRELVLFALIGGLPPPLATDSPDWTKILGANPEAYDLSGIDPHMIPSTEPRPGLTGADLPVGNNGDDPINGREYQTQKEDLQFACTFALAAPESCAVNAASCDCMPGSTLNPPLCSAPGTQIRGKAYPTTRELRVVRGLAERGIVGSVCAPTYDATMTAISARLAPKLTKP